MNYYDEIMNSIFYKKQFWYMQTYEFNKKTVTLYSNEQKCIRWANTYFEKFFTGSLQATVDERIYAYYVDSGQSFLPNLDIIKPCKLFLHQTGFSNLNGDLFLMPRRFIHRCRDGVHQLVLSLDDIDNIRVPARLLREILTSGYLRLHASCAVIQNKAFLIMGNKSSGKTTLLCNLLNLGAEFCANDRTIVYHDGRNLIAFGHPVSVRLAHEMVAAMPKLNKLNLEEMCFNDINNQSEKIEISPNELRKIFATNIAQYHVISGVIIPSFCLGGKLTCLSEEKKEVVLYNNILNPDPAFPEYYRKNCEVRSYSNLLSDIIELPWSKITGDFYNLNTYLISEFLHSLK